MPTYEYACTACGERTEAKQSFDDPPLEKCPACGGKLRRLYSPVGIVFKGSGFYSTEAKRGATGDKKPAGKSGDKSGEKSSDSSGSKSDPAPAKTTATKSEKSA